jgi:hypothetical protein
MIDLSIHVPLSSLVVQFHDDALFYALQKATSMEYIKELEEWNLSQCSYIYQKYLLLQFITFLFDVVIHIEGSIYGCLIDCGQIVETR